VNHLHTDPESNAGSKRNIPPASGQASIAISLTSAPGRNSTRFIAGTTLIAGSFLVYLAYPIIILILPFSGSIKVGAAVVVWLASWGVFSAGIFLAGPEGFKRFKGLGSRIMSSHSWTKPDRR
jgi:uncharacterized membrane protein